MAIEVVTDLRYVDDRLAETKASGQVAGVSTKAQMFKDETFYLKDDLGGQLMAFSNRQNRFFEWSWGTSPSKPSDLALVEAEVESILVAAFTEADTRWPGLPFSFVYSERCPTVSQLSNNKTDLAIATAIVNTVNKLRPDTAIRRDPPINLGFKLSDRVIAYGEVYGHSKVVMIENVDFDFSKGTPPGVLINGEPPK